MSRMTSNNGINLLKQFEGCRLIAYKPVSTEKYYTIGYGHYGPDVTKGMEITKEKAEELLKKDLKSFEKSVNDYVKVDITQHMFDSIVSFTYNCGAGALKSSTLLRKLNAKDYIGAADEFAKWNKSGQVVLKGLTIRRSREKELFLRDYTSLLIPTESITPKSSLADIKWLQDKLNKSIPGKWPLKVDGVYGENTKIAVLLLWESLAWNKDDSADGWRAGSKTINKIK